MVKLKINMDYKITELKKNIDDRGWLAEVIREDIIGEFKQVYVATMKKGVTRGNHYHKNRREWFCVIKGIARMTLWVEGGVTTEIIMDEKELRLIEVPPLAWHKLENIGKGTLIKISATSDLYDKNNTDTYNDERLK